NNPILLDEVNSIMQKLQNSESNSDAIPKFAPCFTPYKTNLEILLMARHKDCAIASGPVLKQDFTRMSMEYLIKPKSYLAMAQDNGVKISIQENSAQTKTEVVMSARKKRFDRGANKIYQIADKNKNILDYDSSENQLSDSNVETSTMKVRKRKNKKLNHACNSKNFDSSENHISDSVVESSTMKVKKRKNGKLDNVRRRKKFESSENELSISDAETRTLKLRKEKNEKLDNVCKSKVFDSSENQPSDPDMEVRIKKLKKRKLESFDSPEKEAGYISPDNSDYFKGLHPLTKAMLLKHIKQNNVKLDDMLDEKSTQLETSECCKTSSISAHSRSHSQSKRTEFSSLTSCVNSPTFSVNNTTNKIHEMPLTENESNITIYISNSEYWIFDAAAKRMSSEDFESNVMMQFPTSFQWLLKECARILYMTVQELYSEVLKIELMLQKDIHNFGKKKKKKKK
ncbi:hypothetical protein L9F63_019938, partial [Diploptera punctata]